MSIISELNRRNVFRVAAAYVVVGWLLVEVATTLLPTFGAPEWVARAFVVIVALGFLPAVIFAWVYELTPEGLKKESEVLQSASITRHTARKLDLITIIAVVLGVGFLGLSRYVAPPVPSASSATGTAEDAPALAEDSSVAVLPFINMSADAQNEYFSDGLTETLLHMLAQVNELKVAARTSTFAFKGQQKDIREIAAALNVAHVLEGSVQRSGNRVRITAQLIRANDGFHVWSETYDRTLDDIFDIQDEIAEEVSGALTRSLFGESASAIARVDTESVGAYEAYLRALSQIAVGSYGALNDAERALKSALALDPGFADAKVLLARVFDRQANTGMITRERAWALSSPLLDEVIDEHPDDFQAQTAAIINDAEYQTEMGNGDAFYAAIPELQRLVAEAPGENVARIVLANMLAIYNQDDESYRLFEQAIELDPLNPQLHWLYGERLLDDGHVDDAENRFQRSSELSPDNPNVYVSLGKVRRDRGDGVGYVKLVLKAMDVDPQDSEMVSLLADYLYAFGVVEEADELLRRAEAVAPAHPMTRATRVYRSLAHGDEDTALADARQMLLDDVENRHGAYETAAGTFADLSVARGEAAAAYALIDEVAPAANRPENAKIPLKYIFAQGRLFSLWSAALPEADARAKLQAWDATGRRYGFTEEDSPWEYVEVYALLDEPAKAADVALEYALNEPVAANPDWRRFFSRPELAEVIGQPAVAARLDTYAAEATTLRQDLETFLAQR